MYTVSIFIARTPDDPPNVPDFENHHNLTHDSSLPCWRLECVEFTEKSYTAFWPCDTEERLNIFESFEKASKAAKHLSKKLKNFIVRAVPAPSYNQLWDFGIELSEKSKDFRKISWFLTPDSKNFLLASRNTAHTRAENYFKSKFFDLTTIFAGTLRASQNNTAYQAKIKYAPFSYRNNSDISDLGLLEVYQGNLHNIPRVPAKNLK